ncbi:WYL domain-containing protein [Selenomonas sp. GACV-9]|nr:WYL domain-containing protein [Selenomonas ruminantium]
MSEKNIQFLLLIEALKNTNRMNTKTAGELAEYIAEEWEALYPDEPMKPISPSTIGRHVKDMNATGLYNIVTSNNMRNGYYNDKFLFDAAEFVIIAQALYRSTTLSVAETKDILNKLLNQTDDVGEGYFDVIHHQLYKTNRAPKRKISGRSLPVIEKIIKAIGSKKQISFSYYNWSDKDRQRPGLMEDDESNKIKNFMVSPYFVVWESDECYLIGHMENEGGAEEDKYLSHFKVSQIGENIRITNRECTSITCMKEFERYHLMTTIYPSVTGIRKKNGKMEIGGKRSAHELAAFALDRYMRENPYMIHDNQDVIGVQLIFKNGFIGELLTRFNLDSKRIKAYPIGRFAAEGEELYSAQITVQPNEGFYTWLMGHANDVMVSEPVEIRQEVERRLQKALKAIKEYDDEKML